MARQRQYRRNDPAAGQANCVQADDSGSDSLMEELARRLANLEDALLGDEPVPNDNGKNYPYHLDSAASPTHTAEPHVSMKPVRNKLTQIADGTSTAVTHQGPIQIQTTNHKVITIPRALHAPKIKQNLLSVHDLSRVYGKVTFYPSTAIIHSKSNPDKITATARFKNGTYQLVQFPSKATRSPYTPIRNKAHAARTLPWMAQRQAAQREPRTSPSAAPNVRACDRM